MAKSDRFQIIHQEGNGLTKATLQVILDTATGVQYLAWHEIGRASCRGRV